MEKSKNGIEHLGSYIAEKLAGSKLTIERAVEIQEALEKKGIYKPLGSIIVESGELDNKTLDECLVTLWEDVLHKVSLFETLSREELAQLASAAESEILPSGKIVYRSSDKGDNYYVVASGAVRVFKPGNGSADVTFAVLGPGEGFGEIALLTDEPRSASVETMERTCLIRIPRDTFIKAVFSNAASAKTCARILAERLARDNVHIVEASATGLAYRQFISDQVRRDVPMLIGNSPAIMKLISEIDDIAGNSRPVLVTGEPGTELLDVAGLIHLVRSNSQGLLMGMDAKAAGLADTPEVNVGDPLVLELIQSSTLFGRGHNALPFAPDRRLGLLTMARSGIVVIENIEHLAPRVQEKLADYIEKNWFHPVGESDMVPSNARIIATSASDLDARSAAGSFDKRLHGLLSGQTLTVPPLRKRKKDIRMIVDELIRRNIRKMGKHVRGIHEEAYKSLMGYDWPGNTEELSVVIRRAVSIARSDLLMVEDIFIGPPPVTGKFTVNLLKYEPVMKFFKSSLYPKAGVLLTAPFIILLIVLGLFGPQSPERNIALILTWGLWEPMLVLSAFFTGRLWCSVCPVGALSALVRRTVGLHLKAPLFIRNYGYYFSALGIAVIIGAEAASGMLGSPRATALLVLSIATFAAVTGFLFQRSAWCRYLCPLGSIVGTLSTCAIVELRSNYSVCNSTCQNHDCYTGGPGREGCPMFEGPFSLSSNRNCVLCGSCIKTCPNQSPVLNVRLPGYDLWTVRRAEPGIAMVGLALMGTQVFRGMEMAGLAGPFPENTAASWMSALSLVAASILASMLYVMLAGRSVFGSRTGADKGHFLIIYALIPLIFAFEADYHLERMLTLGGHFLEVVGRQLGLAFELPGISAKPFTIKALQVLLLFSGAVGSCVIIRKMLRRKEDVVTSLKPFLRRAWPALVLAAVYGWMFLVK